MDPTHPDASPLNGAVPPVHSRFHVGQKGGPGRPRGAWPTAAIAREFARGWEDDAEAENPDHRIGKVARDFAVEFVEASRAGNLKKVLAMAKVIERIEGKPQEHVDHSGDVATVHLVGFDSPEETEETKP